MISISVQFRVHVVYRFNNDFLYAVIRSACSWINYCNMYDLRKKIFQADIIFKFFFLRISSLGQRTLPPTRVVWSIVYMYAIEMRSSCQVALEYNHSRSFLVIKSPLQNEENCNFMNLGTAPLRFCIKVKCSF